MLPIELSRELRADSVTLTLQIDAGLFWFQGHFPHLPILPGVAQLDWVMHYGVSLLAPGKQFVAVDNIKFQQPVLPDSLLQLRLDWDAEKSRLSFRYSLLKDDGEQAASSGKIALC
ncbi:3-hydroxyacyl-ACP dehydratase FabZ family protein [Pantoea agglomerans]|uniref:3-hydroxyacyl-ACP dehydratase FabZ family protein n=1 Tax=Enterobacter agglomerans TaxID=549 RepID=UPI0020323200|nr:hydroxymyristoyl-ACP dehydratase [Pantoea agglomerans]URW96314.1 hydroxymyristoyl-ACP dehydratase [Pantoea agglomerans]